MSLPRGPSGYAETAVRLRPRASAAGRIIFLQAAACRSCDEAQRTLRRLIVLMSPYILLRCASGSIGKSQLLEDHLDSVVCNRPSRGVFDLIL